MDDKTIDLYLASYDVTAKMAFHVNDHKTALILFNDVVDDKETVEYDIPFGKFSGYEQLAIIILFNSKIYMDSKELFDRFQVHISMINNINTYAAKHGIRPENCHCGFRNTYHIICQTKNKTTRKIWIDDSMRKRIQFIDVVEDDDGNVDCVDLVSTISKTFRFCHI